MAQDKPPPEAEDFVNAVKHCINCQESNGCLGRKSVKKCSMCPKFMKKGSCTLNGMIHLAQCQWLEFFHQLRVIELDVEKARAIPKNQLN